MMSQDFCAKMNHNCEHKKDLMTIIVIFAFDNSKNEELCSLRAIFVQFPSEFSSKFQNFPAGRS